MDDTSRMIRLLRRLRTETNGAVVGAMQDRGLDYPFSYGVSAVTIREIAADYGPDHSLALLLFRQQVRELKLAAAFVDDPSQVSPAQMREWACDFTNAELAEQVVHALFRHTDGVSEMALEWMESTEGMLRYAGLLMTASVTKDNCTPELAERLLDAAGRIAGQSVAGVPLARGVVRAMMRIAVLSPATHDRVKKLSDEYAVSREPSLKNIAEELGWQLEYTEH